MTTPQSLRRKPLSSAERAALRVASTEPRISLNLTDRMARAKGDPVATARLMAAITAGARAT